MNRITACIAPLCIAALTACSNEDGPASAAPAKEVVDEKLAAVGSIEVTAKLIEVPGLDEYEGDFPANDLGYDYVYPMKYKVIETHRGALTAETIVVGHYNPLKPRSEAADGRCPDIGGNLKRIRVGDTHRMALEPAIDDHYMGPIFNAYHDQDIGPIYWAVWTNAAGK